MGKRDAVLLGLAALAALAAPARADEKAGGIRAGAYAIDITPTKLPVSVNGGMQDRMLKEVNDHLHARCLVLDDGKTRIALVVCDSCMIPRELMDAAKLRAARATGITPDHILISATHTHSAPTVGGVFQSEPDKDYQDLLVERIAQGVEKATQNLAPAKVGWGVGRNADQ